MSASKVDEVKKILARIDPKRVSVSDDGFIVVKDEEAAKALRDLPAEENAIRPLDTNINLGPVGCFLNGGNVIFC